MPRRRGRRPHRAGEGEAQHRPVRSVGSDDGGVERREPGRPDPGRVAARRARGRYRTWLECRLPAGLHPRTARAGPRTNLTPDGSQALVHCNLEPGRSSDPSGPGVRKRIRNAPWSHPGRRHRSLTAATGTQDTPPQTSEVPQRFEHDQETGNRRLPGSPSGPLQPQYHVHRRLLAKSTARLRHPQVD